MQIETARRLQRLERCAALIQAHHEPDEAKAENLCYIAGYAALLKGIEHEGAQDTEDDVVAAVVNLDQFCEAIEQTTQQEH